MNRTCFSSLRQRTMLNVKCSNKKHLLSFWYHYKRSLSGTLLVKAHTHSSRYFFIMLVTRVTYFRPMLLISCFAGRPRRTSVSRVGVRNGGRSRSIKPVDTSPGPVTQRDQRQPGHTSSDIRWGNNMFKVSIFKERVFGMTYNECSAVDITFVPSKEIGFINLANFHPSFV